MPDLPVSVVVPVRNAEQFLEACLDSIVAEGPRELIVVDGCSTDRTVEIARRYTDRVISDEGRGVAYARVLGASTASSLWVATIDVDVIVPPGALHDLFGEFIDDGYTALQAGLASVSGPGYWGRALAHHHRTGRSKDWFGVVATILERKALLAYGFDESFRSGEDIDLRWRLRKAGEKIGVSKRTIVMHRFEDSWEFAKGQFDADGRGLARMAAKHGPRGQLLLAMPILAAGRGVARNLVRLDVRWVPYYACYAAYNYRAIVSERRSAPTPVGSLVGAPAGA